MKYNKLVRDLIPDIIEKSGNVPITHIASDHEYIDALNAKLHEEVNEFLDDPSVEEFADILEVLYAICKYKKINLADLEDTRLKKLDQRGGFDKRIILESAK